MQHKWGVHEARTNVFDTVRTHHSTVGVLVPFASVQAAAYIVGSEALLSHRVGQRVPAAEMLGDLFQPLVRDAGIVPLGYHLIRTIYCLRSEMNCVPRIATGFRVSYIVM